MRKISLLSALFAFGCYFFLAHHSGVLGSGVGSVASLGASNTQETQRNTHSSGAPFRVENSPSTYPPSLDVSGNHPAPLDLQFIQKPHFSIQYDNRRRGPAEVDYDLSQNTRSGEHLRRPQIPFATDMETSARVTTRDFSGCGYDRGHMCPSFAMGAFYGKDAMASTFVCSNILPQTHLNNDGVWNSIERMEADDFAKRFGSIHVVDGPVYNETPTRTKSGISIPAAFYKVIRRPDGAVICFLVPQITSSPKPENYLTSLDLLRKLTGLNILPDVSPVESSRVRTKIW